MRTNPLRSEVKSLRASPISNGGAGGGGSGEGGGLFVGVCLAGGVTEGCGGSGGGGDGLGEDSGTTSGELVGAPDQVTWRGNKLCFNFSRSLSRSADRSESFMEPCLNTRACAFGRESEDWRSSGGATGTSSPGSSSSSQ
jgi:hypothetical protein